MNTQPESLGVHKRMTALTILLFALFELFYLAYGYAREMTIFQCEDAARLGHTFSGAWLNPLATGNPWLPLPHAIQWAVFQISPGQKILLLGSITQKILTIAAGLIAALLAGKLTKSWVAVALTLAAWAGSTRLSLISIGYLSEPTLHLAVLAGLYCGWCWFESKKTVWLTLAIIAVVAMQLSRYEGWAISGFFYGAWLVVMVKNHTKPIVAKACLGLLVLAVVPLAWMSYNYAHSGDPLEFLHITQGCLTVNVPADLNWKVAFLKQFIANSFDYQPLVIIGLILLTAVPSCWANSRLLVLLILAVLGINIALTLIGATAPFYPERLPSSVYVLLCVVFGAVASNFLVRIKPQPQRKLLLAGVILIIITAGVTGFVKQVPQQTDDFKAMSILVAGEIPKSVSSLAQK